jgi:predicted NBD/HSP70 family sugar kinase/N-acetylmuramic acid 6-phosphate (MurNAc-6-P) etherase/ribosomal protein S18 acetylase RimI-like enzyme
MSGGLVGFNPVHLARNVTIEQLQTLAQGLFDSDVSTFRKLTLLLAKRCSSQLPTAPNYFGVINPIIGPEPVTGSSRMKGGSATMILLDCFCLRLIGKTDILEARSELLPLSKLDCLSMMSLYQMCHSQTYASFQQTLPAVMEGAAESIKCGGRLVYLGAGSGGALGCIDASEMPDTYGAPFDQTRGFVYDGWLGLKAKEGDISHMSYLHRIGFASFDLEIVPSLSHIDSVVVLLSSPESLRHEEITSLEASTTLAAQMGARISILCASFVSLDDLITASAVKTLLLTSTNQIVYTHLRLPVVSRDNNYFARHVGFTDFSVKIMTNAVSTFAQAKGRGAVYKSLMITTGPANDKIYMRCVHMIADNVGVSLITAEEALIKSIYGFDALPANFVKLHSREDHIRAGVLPADQRHRSQSILPVAFLVASNPSLSIACARAAVAAEPRVAVLLRQIFDPLTRSPPMTTCPVARQAGDDVANEKSTFVVGIDLGGTNIRAAAIHPSSGMYLSEVVRRAVIDRSITGVLALIEEVYDAVLTSYDSLHTGKFGCVPVAVSVGQPGCIGEDGSISKLANFPEWGTESAMIAHCISRKYRSPARDCIFVFDDAASALQAELTFGEARLAASAVMLTIGTGFGTAVSFDGKSVYRGSRGLIEGGHSIVQATTTEACGKRGLQCCSCGQFGCLETLCSASALKNHIQNVNDESKSEKSLQYHLAIGIINAMRFYDPAVVILGGGLAPSLFDGIVAVMRSVVWKLHDDLQDIPVMLATTIEPGVLGSAALAVKELQLRKDVLPQHLAAKPHFRRAIGKDLTDLYMVCLRTGDAGSDGSHLYSDPALLGSIYVGPYLKHSASFAFTLVHEGAAVGYTLGALDTIEFNRTCEREWWPVLRKKYAVENTVGMRDNEKELIANEIYVHRCGPSDGSEEVLSADRVATSLYEKYPSHMHIDILPSMQGRGYGVLMVNRLLYSLRLAGSCGVHLCMHSSNTRAFHFYTTKLGFKFVMNRGPEEWILAREL